MHEYLLARWGVTIGELWDLERLAVECKRRNRWTFMLTSSPNNVNGEWRCEFGWAELTGIRGYRDMGECNGYYLRTGFGGKVGVLGILVHVLADLQHDQLASELPLSA